MERALQLVDFLFREVATRNVFTDINSVRASASYWTIIEQRGEVISKMGVSPSVLADVKCNLGFTVHECLLGLEGEFPIHPTRGNHAPILLDHHARDIFPEIFSGASSAVSPTLKNFCIGLAAIFPSGRKVMPRHSSANALLSPLNVFPASCSR